VQNKTFTYVDGFICFSFRFLTSLLCLDFDELFVIWKFLIIMKI